MKRSILLASLILVALPALADDGRQIRPVTNALTQAECSACHMAYPAGFLPARSWQKIMATLEDHFGEDASLDEASRAEIEAWLVANAADAGGRRSGVLRRLDPNDTPMRISELPWFRREHSGEVSPRWLKKAGSWANCNVCHRGAEKGYFDDD